jgi:hypothetical protein
LKKEYDTLPVLRLSPALDTLFAYIQTPTVATSFNVSKSYQELATADFSKDVGYARNIALFHAVRDALRAVTSDARVSVSLLSHSIFHLENAIMSRMHISKEKARAQIAESLKASLSFVPAAF